MNEEQVPEKEQQKISKKKCTDWIIDQFKRIVLREKSLSIIAILISIIALFQTCEANKIAKDANTEAKRAYSVSYETQNIIALSEIITKIQVIYAKNNGKNISSEDKEVLTNIFNRVELLVSNNFSSSQDFTLVKEKGEHLKEVIYLYLYQMNPDFKREVAIGGEDRAELPNTGTLPELEAAFLAYKHVFMDYLSKYND